MSNVRKQLMVTATLMHGVELLGGSEAGLALADVKRDAPCPQGTVMLHSLVSPQTVVFTVHIPEAGLGPEF